MRQLAFDFFTHGDDAEKDTHSVDTLKTQPSIPDVLSQMHAQPIGEKKGFDLTPVFSYHLERAKRKTVGFIVDERGVTVRAPRWVSVAEIERMLQEKEGWIQKNLPNSVIGKKSWECKPCTLLTEPNCLIWESL